MTLLVICPFHDAEHGDVLRLTGERLTATDERAERLVSLGLCAVASQQGKPKAKRKPRKAANDG